MKEILLFLILFTPNLLAQNPVSGGPIPQSTYTTPSYIGNTGGGATLGNIVNVATNCPATTLNVSCFQVFADVVETPGVNRVWDVVTTNGGSNISCGLSDCAFSSSDVGTKYIQATSNCFSAVATVTVNKTLITGFTNANTISIAPATASATGTTSCAKYGHDDTAALRAAWAVCTANIAAKPCNLQLPSGDMFFQKALFVDTTANRVNAYAITGQGATSVLTPTTDFDTTTCLMNNGSFGNASNGTNSYAIFETTGGISQAIPNVDVLKDFAVDGMNIPGGAPSGTNYCGGITIQRAETYNVHLWDWMYGGSSAAHGFVMVGPSEVHGTTVNNFGFNQCVASGNNNGAVTLEQSYCTGGVSNCLEVTGTAYSYGSFYGPCSSQVVSVHSGSLTSYGDIIQNLPTFGMKVGDTAAAQFNCNGSIIGLTTDTGAPSVYIYATGVFNIQTGCQLQHSVGSGQLFGGLAGGVAYDGACGPLSGTPQGDGIATINMMGDCSITGIPQVIGNIVLSGNWGTSPSVALSGPTVQDTKVEQFTITVGSGAPGANPVVTVTFPQKFWTTQVPICDVQQIGGTQAALAVPFTNGTINNTSAAFTYNGTPTASTTIIAKMHCSVNN